MAWCLIKSEQESFKKALIEKKLDPFKLSEMTSEQRRVEFKKYVSAESAENINSLYESKLLLKNQVTGFKNWVKRSAGMKTTIKRDLISKIDRLNDSGVLNPSELKNFKEDMVRTRLGFNITFEEAKNINQLSESRVEAKKFWDEDIKNNPTWSEDTTGTRKEWINNKNRAEYGIRQVALENYVNSIKLEAKNIRVTFKEDPIRAMLNPIKESPTFFNNLFKSIGASLDNSFFGRQGIKNLYGNVNQKKIWVRNFLKSFGDISSELRRKKINGFEPMDFIKADIYSRPNAMNGKYSVGKYGLDILSEEIFPTSLPERVPGFGRLFKASETAFSGGALRMRADLTDLLIDKMNKQGINALDPIQARAAGNLVGSLTGRGNLGDISPSTASQLNFLLWSPKFFKANFDTVTAHSFDKKSTTFSRSEARKNLLSIVAHVAGISLIAKLLDPESVDEDPRSTNFGRIKVFGYWVDITGGMRTIAIMASRMTPTRRNGEWGVWRKSGSGNWTNLTARKFGSDDAVDVFIDSIFLNKLAPVGSIMRDYYRGEMFGGDPFSIKESIIRSAVPFSIQNVIEVKDEKFENIMGVMVSEFFGLSVSTYRYNSSWESKTSKEMKDFKSQVGEDLFKKSNDDYNRAYNIWFDEVQKDPRYKELSDDGRSKLLSEAKSALKEKILKEYGYREKKTIKTREEVKEGFEIKKLAP